MANPPPPSLTERFVKLAQSLQFVWFVGHVSMLIFSFRYALYYISMKTGSSWAGLSYRVAFISAIITYGIVVYKGFRARLRQGRPTTAIALISDENVQYLLMALVWLWARQVPLALFPFAVYSIFHVATYVRGNILPTVYPPTTTSPEARPRPTGAVADAIGNFIRDYYDASMTVVALLEIALWFRLLFSAVIFTRGSWIQLGLYTLFLRSRYSQSKFVSNSLANLGARADAHLAKQGTDPRVRQAWEGVKGGLKHFVDLTDAQRYIGPQTQGPRKAQ